MNTTNPVAALMTLLDQRADIKVLFSAMNENYAVTKYGSKIVVASIVGKELEFITDDDFHKIFANLVVYKEIKSKNGAVRTEPVKVSKRWFEWEGRRYYLGRGVVFEPGGPLEIKNDMLNVWRGFGIVPKSGHWSLLRAHIIDVVCSGQQKHFDYLIRWMAYAVQHPEEPMGVAVAFLGPQGAGKGIVARTFGKFFGKHFTHIANGDQLTGRFNASLGKSCAVFLDEALWAGDKKGEGVLKALITEPSFQLEAKFRDAIMVENRLRIMIASNNDWAVPAGIGDRRWFVLNVANTFAGTEHRTYWTALYSEIENGGAAAMLHELLAIDLSGFDVRAVPQTTAKAQQQVHSLHGTVSWLHHALQEGSIRYRGWNEDGLTISTNDAYECYKEFSKQQHDWRPDIKAVWSKLIRAVLGPNVRDARLTNDNGRFYSFEFAPLADCRRQFAKHLGAPDLEWQELGLAPDVAAGETTEGFRVPTELDALPDAPELEWEPELEPELDNWREYEPEVE